jgi:hypothetical protein
MNGFLYKNRRTVWRLINIFNKIKEFRIRSAKTRSILLFLFFVFLSAIFWCFITLNQSTQQNLTIPLEITSVPQGVTLITQPQTSIDITVKDKGSSFIEYLFKPMQKLKIKFSDYTTSNGILRLNTVQLQAAVKKLLNQTATVLTISPDQIVIKYTTLPGKKVPIKWYYSIEADTPRYVQNGPVWISQDSVTVYSDQETLDETQKIYTNLIQESGLKDTLRRRVTFEQSDGMRIEPHSVTLIVPIEQMFTKTKTVPITVVNEPKGQSLIVFPSTVQVSYLIPKSELKTSGYNVKAIVDYNSINFKSKSNKVAVKFGGSLASYNKPKISTDSVEYIIEKE